LQREDNEALEQALALLQNTVFSFSMKVCGQRHDAEDTMLTAFVGLNLLQCGFTNWCPMMTFLRKLGVGR